MYPTYVVPEIMSVNLKPRELSEFCGRWLRYPFIRVKGNLLRGLVLGGPTMTELPMPGKEQREKAVARQCVQCN